jgi:hypothetical protein
MDVYRECVTRLQAPRVKVRNTRLTLVTAERISDWSQRTDRLDPKLTGSGILYVFAKLTANTETVDPHDDRRSMFAVQARHLCQVSKDFLCIKSDAKPSKLIPRR